MVRRPRGPLASALFLAGRLVLTFAIAAATSLIGREFQIESGVSIFYPTTAIGVLACMWLGLPGAIAVAMAVIATPWEPQIDPRQLALSGVLTTMEGLIPWAVFRLRRDLSSDLRDMKSLAAFLLAGTLVNTGLSAILGNLLVVVHPPGVYLVWRELFVWWIADFTAALLIATPVLAFGGALLGKAKSERARTLSNALQVVTAILLLGFAASFAIRTYLGNRLEKERLAQQQTWLSAEQKLNRMHANFMRSTYIRTDDPAAAARLESARRRNDAFISELAPALAASPVLEIELARIADSTRRWFADTRETLTGHAGPGRAEATFAESSRYILALRAMMETDNRHTWQEYTAKRRKIMAVSTLLDGMVFLTLVFATVVLLYTIPRPFAQLGGAVRAMREGEPLDAARIDGRYLEFRAIADRLEETSRELRRREEELRLQTEKAVAASRHKSEFLAKMSHELRTPLNSIIGFSDLLTEQEATISTTKRLGFLENVANSARHLLSLINDLLDIAKVEAGKLQLHLESVDLRRCIANTVAPTQSLFDRKQQQVAIEMPDEPMRAWADPGRIEQVLLNLLSNANKFSPPGERIAVRGTRDGSMWRIDVADRGIGISAEDASRIFDEFEQIHSHGEHSTGTGLGLALARHFVEAHGGRIEVNSTPGQGATFSILLPADTD